MKVPVLFPKIFNYPFTYNSDLEEILNIGDLVIAPFGNKLEIGVIWNKIQPTSKKVAIQTQNVSSQHHSARRNVAQRSLSQSCCFRYTSRYAHCKITL